MSPARPILFLGVHELETPNSSLNGYTLGMEWTAATRSPAVNELALGVPAYDRQCANCGYGIATRGTPRCPMCGGTSWQTSDRRYGAAVLDAPAVNRRNSAGAPRADL